MGRFVDSNPGLQSRFNKYCLLTITLQQSYSRFSAISASKMSIF